MTRSKHPAVICGLLLCGALACIQAPVRVEVEERPGADLSGVTKFALVPPPWEHPVVGETIEQEIRAALTAKGLTEVPVAEADIAVSYRATAVRDTRIRTVADPDVSSYKVQEDYLKGTCEIDVFDARTRAVLWRGVGRIDFVAESSARPAAGKATRAILAEFLPEP